MPLWRYLSYHLPSKCLIHMIAWHCIKRTWQTQSALSIGIKRTGYCSPSWESAVRCSLQRLRGACAMGREASSLLSKTPAGKRRERLNGYCLSSSAATSRCRFNQSATINVRATVACEFPRWMRLIRILVWYWCFKLFFRYVLLSQKLSEFYSRSFNSGR